MINLSTIFTLFRKYIKKKYFYHHYKDMYYKTEKNLFFK